VRGRGKKGGWAGDEAGVRAVLACTGEKLQEKEEKKEE